MQKLGSPGRREDIEPLVRPRGPRPFELPRLGVPEKVDFREPFLIGGLNREGGQELEGGAGGVVRVVPGLEQEQPPPVTGAIGGGNAAPSGGQEQQPEPSARRGPLRQPRVEPLEGGIRTDGRARLRLPPRRLEPNRILARLLD